jgi:hypothetical protein
VNDLLDRLAAGLLTVAAQLLPREAAAWAAAMRRELAEAPDGWAAACFAAGCLRAALVIAAAAQLNAAYKLVRSAQWSSTMTNILRRPRLLGLACGALAVTAGLAYLSLAGAPSRHLMVNLLALALGAAMWVALGRAASSRLVGAGFAVLVLAGGLLATALFGVAVSGASRWVQLGPISVQTSLVLLPAMIVLYARRPDTIGTAGMAVAAAALALQPDRAMAGVLAAGLLALACSARSRLPALAAAAAATAFGWTLLKPDRLPAVPYVDQVFHTAFGVHPLAGVAVATGTAVLLLPAVARLSGQEAGRSAINAFGACWLAVVAAATLGNYPTPLVGYGGAAVLGYLLSVALLPSGGTGESYCLDAKEEAPVGRQPDRPLSRLGLGRSAALC